MQILLQSRGWLVLSLFSKTPPLIHTAPSPKLINALRSFNGQTDQGSDETTWTLCVIACVEIAGATFPVIPAA